MILPDAFLQQMQELPGNAFPEFLAAMDAAPTTSVRLHPSKGTGRFAEEQTLPWSPLGRKLKERPFFTMDPSFHAGAYYVQDASSQFLETALRQHVDFSQPLTILDLCAAPGGKTTHLLSLLVSGSTVIANEVIGSRAKILQENVWKWGMPDVLLTSADPKMLARTELQVDVLVVDAPCSGEGLFRKDPDAVGEWSPGHVQHCASRQKRILADAWPLLKTEGILLYSTCTWNTQENEDVVTWCEEELGAELLPLEGALHLHGKVARFFPQDNAGEGLSCAVLRKTAVSSARGKNRPAKEFLEGRSLLQKSIYTPESFIPVLLGNTVYALPKHMEGTLSALLAAKISMYGAGIPLGEVFGARKESKPHPMLPLSTAFARENFEEIAFDKEQALAFLRRQDVNAPAKNKRIVATYEGLCLGFGRAQNGRIGSLFPMDYRIRR